MSLVIEVYVDVWANNNGVDPDGVPDDVKKYILNHVQVLEPNELGWWKSVTLNIPRRK